MGHIKLKTLVRQLRSFPLTRGVPKPVRPEAKASGPPTLSRRASSNIQKISSLPTPQVEPTRADPHENARRLVVTPNGLFIIDAEVPGQGPVVYRYRRRTFSRRTQLFTCQRGKAGYRIKRPSPFRATADTDESVSSGEGECSQQPPRVNHHARSSCKFLSPQPPTPTPHPPKPDFHAHDDPNSV